MLGQVGPLPEFTSPYESDAAAAYYAARVTGMPEEQAVIASREAAGLPAGETEHEARTRLIKHLSAIAGGPSEPVKLDELEGTAQFEAWLSQVEAAGLDPDEIIEARAGNIEKYETGGIASRIGDFMDRSGLGDLITYGTIAVAAAGGATAIASSFGAPASGAAGGSGAGAGTGAGAGQLTPITVTASKLPVVSAPGVVLPSAATAGASTVQTMSAANAVLEAATAGKSAAEAAAIASTAKKAIPKVVDGVNKARTIAAVANGEAPPPPIDLEGDSFTDWAVSVSKGLIEEKLREQQRELAEAEQRELDEILEAEVRRIQREAARRAPPEQRRLGPTEETAAIFKAGEDARWQTMLKAGVTIGAVAIVLKAARS